jgi:predicted RNA-binding protein with PUA-like domain
VQLKPLYEIKRAISLAEIKKDPHLAQLPLLKQSRLSVMPLSKEEFESILKKGDT